jgi:hypothetical protein
LNPISKWFWKRAAKHEMLSLARTLALVAGLLLILSGVIGVTPLLLGLILGVGVILLAGRLKHRLWSGGFLVAGLFSYYSMEGLIAQGGAVLLVIAAALGLASTFV